MSDVVAAILSAGWPLGIAAGLAALGMGIAAGKAFEAISRQPDASGDIRSLTLIAFAFIGVFGYLRSGCGFLDAVC